MAEAFDVAAIGEFRGTITFTGEIDPTNGDPIVLIDGETIYRQRPFDVPESVRISYVPADPERDN